MAINRLSYIGVGGGSAALGAWLLLKMTGSGRPEAGWLDWSGLAIGWSWIGLWALILYHDLLSNH